MSKNILNKVNTRPYRDVKMLNQWFTIEEEKRRSKWRRKNKKHHQKHPIQECNRIPKRYNWNV
jgi:hypothetical protein